MDQQTQPENPERVTARRPILELKGLCKRFGSVVAVDDVSLTINRGEFFCLLGASGCGKTTLMRLIAGFETPDSGRMILDDADIVGMPPHHRPVNMMFQSYALFPHMNVAENIAFGLKQAGMARGEINRQVAGMVQLVQLQGLETRRPQQISGGQRQRVALARALARQPRLLLLDEPLAALDKKLRLETQARLKQIQHSLGTSFMVVTHDPDEAMGLADRIAVMEHGRIVQTGSPADIYERPVSHSVAAMVGDVNCFACMVSEAGNGQVTAAVPALNMELRHVPAASGILQGAACLIVRPEHVRLSDAPTAGSASGVVTQAAYQGDTWLLHVRHGEEGGANASHVLARVPKSQGSVETGRAVSFSFRPEDCRVVPA